MNHWDTMNVVVPRHVKSENGYLLQVEDADNRRVIGTQATPQAFGRWEASKGYYQMEPVDPNFFGYHCRFLHCKHATSVRHF